jgi:hypothetical protein
MIFIPWFGQVEYLPTPRFCIPTDEVCTQPLSRDPKINLNTMVLFILTISCCEESPQFWVSHALHKWSLMKTRVREESNHTHETNLQQLTHTQQKRWAQRQHIRVTTQNKCPNLNILKQRREFNVSALLDVQWLLGVELHAPRGPFYSPKGPRSLWSSIWKALVAFCSWVHRTVWCTLDSEQWAC